MITGTPAKAGVYNVTISADAEGLQGDEIELQLYIANAADVGGGDGGEATPPAGPVVNMDENTWMIAFVSGISGLFAVCLIIGIIAAVVRKRKNK